MNDDFTLEDFKKSKTEDKEKKKRFSIIIYEKDYIDLQQYKNYKIQKDKNTNFTNSDVVTYGLTLLEKKYNHIERGKEKAQLKRGTRIVDEPTKGTSIVLAQKWLDFINDFIYHKIFNEYKIEFTRAELLREITELIKEENPKIYSKNRI